MAKKRSHPETFSYVPVTETLVQLGLYVTGSGTDIVGPGDAYPHQSHPELYDFSWKAGRVLPEYQFVFISDGSGEFETKQTGKLDVTAGTMMILFPNIWHRYRPSNRSGWTEYWVSVNGDLIFDWQQRGVLSPDQPVHRLQRQEILIRQYEEIIRLLADHPRHQPASISARVLMIIAEVLDHIQSEVGRDIQISNGQELSEVVIAALTEIWNRSHGQLSVATVAQLVGVNRRTLERKFMTEVGRTVHAELTRCRLDRSTRLLSETQVPIKSVAYASGFSSVANMSRVFHRELGICPSEYRKRKQQTNTGSKRRSVLSSESSGHERHR